MVQVHARNIGALVLLAAATNAVLAADFSAQVNDVRARVKTTRKEQAAARESYTQALFSKQIQATQAIVDGFPALTQVMRRVPVVAALGDREKTVEVTRALARTMSDTTFRLTRTSSDIAQIAHRLRGEDRTLMQKAMELDALGNKVERLSRDVADEVCLRVMPALLKARIWERRMLKGASPALKSGGMRLAAEADKVADLVFGNPDSGTRRPPNEVEDFCDPTRPR